MLMITGLFGHQYKEWHACLKNQKDWANFKAWWPEKVYLKHKTSKAAQHFGFGMNSHEQINDQEGINDFASAHAATVATVTSLQQQNAQLNKLLPTM